jgi:hypothetical protein
MKTKIWYISPWSSVGWTETEHHKVTRFVEMGKRFEFTRAAECPEGAIVITRDELREALKKSETFFDDIQPSTISAIEEILFGDK